MQEFTEEEKLFLLKTARKAIENRIMNLDTEIPEDTPEKLLDNKSCFVTLEMKGNLRGCMGSLEAYEPLIQNVIKNAQNAAFNDPRFDPVSKKEMEEIDIEISVLTKPEKLDYSGEEELLEKINPPEDGIFLSKAGKSATFLPLVWEHFKTEEGHDKEGFLAELCLKAGLETDDWKRECNVEVYHTIHIRENKK